VKASFGKRYKIKLRNEIEITFNEGSFFIAYPFKVFFVINPTQMLAGSSIALSVAKRRLKLAVDRNRVKRLMREAYRTQNILLNNACEIHKCNVKIVFVYIGDGVLPPKAIDKGMKKALTEIGNRLQA